MNRPIASLLLLALLAITSPAIADWPEFRGPRGDGHVGGPGETKAAGLPLRWSETENLKWKTEIPYRGWSTPVVKDGQVWLTTATEDGHDFFAICVDAETGKVRFNEKVFHCETPEPLGNNVNCYATPSPAVETGRVYVHFGSYGTACLDTSTAKVLWKRDDLLSLDQLEPVLDDDTPLASLTAHLIMGTTERDFLDEKTVPFDGREARHTVLRAKLDGVPRIYDIYVAKKDGCVYDFVYIAPPQGGAGADAGADAQGTGAFEGFVGGFHTLGSGAL